MQVTLDLDDDLFVQTSLFATETGRTFSEVVEWALREMFDRLDEGRTTKD